MEPEDPSQRRTLMRVAGAVVVTAMLAVGCAAPSGPNSGEGPSDGVRADLDEARARWDEAAVGTYRYVFEDDCAECDPTARTPRQIVVWSGEKFEPGDRTPSIEEIFEAIEGALDADQSVAAIFDPTLGYPTDVTIDPELRPVDGGTHWIVEQLEPRLPGDAVSSDVVARAAEAWSAARPDAYEYTLSVSCDCRLAGSLLVRVEGSRVVSHEVLFDESSGGSVTPMSIDSMFSDLADLMALVDGVVEGGIRFEGSAEFDPRLGYPTWVGLDITILDSSVTVDFPSRIVITITDLRAVETGPEPVSPSQRKELEAAVERWRQAGIGSYRYLLTFHMMATAEFTGPFLVTVEDGQVVDVTREDGGPVAEQRLSAYTVEQLFSIIEEAQAAGVESEVLYHEVWGHPVLVAIDLQAIAVDGGLMLSVSDLAPAA